MKKYNYCYSRAYAISYDVNIRQYNTYGGPKFELPSERGTRMSFSSWPTID